MFFFVCYFEWESYSLQDCNQRNHKCSDVKAIHNIPSQLEGCNMWSRLAACMVARLQQRTIDCHIVSCIPRAVNVSLDIVTLTAQARHTKTNATLIVTS